MDVMYVVYAMYVVHVLYVKYVRMYRCMDARMYECTNVSYVHTDGWMHVCMCACVAWMYGVCGCTCAILCCTVLFCVVLFAKSIY